MTTAVFIAALLIVGTVAFALGAIVVGWFLMNYASAIIDKVFAKMEADKKR